MPLLDNQIIGENLPSRLENGTYKGIPDADVIQRFSGCCCTLSSGWVMLTHNRKGRL